MIASWKAYKNKKWIYRAGATDNRAEPDCPAVAGSFGRQAAGGADFPGRAAPPAHVSSPNPFEFRAAASTTYQNPAGLFEALFALHAHAAFGTWHRHG